MGSSTGHGDAVHYSSGRGVFQDYLPLIAFSAWWLFCFTVYASGWPIDYERINLGRVVPFFFACLVMAILGFRFGFDRRRVTDDELAPARTSAAAFFGLACTLALVIPVARAYSGVGIGDFSYALQNQGEAYAQTSLRISDGIGARGGIVFAQVALAPWTLLALPYFAFMWFERRRFGFFFLLSFAAPIVQSVLSGRDLQIGLSLLIVISSWFIVQRRNRRPVSVKVIAILTVVAIIFLGTFSARKLSRSPDAPICPVGSNVCAFPTHQPSIVDTTLAYTASYSAQGFEGLGRAMGGTWNFGGGIRHSPALVRGLLPVYDVTDTAPISTQMGSLGWSATGFWSTGFADYADDVPWLLIPALVAFLAAFLGFAWRVSLQTAEPLAIAVFSYSWISLFLMPQNLVLAVSGPIYVGYLILVASFLWRLRRGKISSVGPSVEANARADAGTF